MALIRSCKPSRSSFSISVASVRGLQVQSFVELFDQLILLLGAHFWVGTKSQHGFGVLQPAKVLPDPGRGEQPLLNRLLNILKVLLERFDQIIRLCHRISIGEQFFFGSDETVKIGAFVLRTLEGFENRQEAVVFLLSKRLEFVIVATGTAECQAREGRRCYA